MTANALFHDAKLKLCRASVHIAALRKLSDDHFAAHPPEQEFKQMPPNPDGTPHYSISVKVKRVPKEYDAILGDVIHNLRAALDLMAVDLVRVTPAASGSPGNTKGVYFPFCDDPTDLDKMIKDKKFHRAGTDAVSLLKTFQPFKGGNMLLRAIHDLDIQDKHHSIIPTAALASAGVTVSVENGVPVMRPVFQDHVEMTFPEDSVFAGKPILATLEDAAKLVDGIVKAFEAMVAARV